MQNKDELFCSKCLIHDTFFVGGGSWPIYDCSKCKGIDCIYKNLTIIEKIKANSLFNKMGKTNNSVNKN